MPSQLRAEYERMARIKLEEDLESMVKAKVSGPCSCSHRR